jgi:hypothetical protein
MKAKIKNMDIIMDYLPALQELKAMRTGTRIAYNAVKSEKQAREAAKDYDTARLSLLEAACTKGEDGKPAIKDGNYQFDSDEVKKNMEDQIRLLAESEAEVEVWPVNFEEVQPLKDMTGNLLDRLMRYGFIVETSGQTK